MKQIKSTFIIALIAAITLVACPNGEDGGGKDLPGTLQILQYGVPAVSGEVFTGDALTADYSGSEAVTFQWKKGGTDVSANAGGTATEFTPSEPGSYTVTASASGYNSKTSKAVNVVGEAMLSLSGNVTIYKGAAVGGTAVPVTTAETGERLTAFYDGTENVAFQWFNNDTAVQDYAATVNADYTPVTSGTYTVKVSYAGYASKVSSAVTVTGASLITITFDLNGASGTNPTRVIAPGQAITARDVLPTVPTYNGFTFKEWNTAQTETGTAVTADTTFNESTTVYARWNFLGGTPRLVEDETAYGGVILVHENPLMEKGSGFTGDISEEDGTISYTAGIFDYSWPTGADFDVGDYAYCDVKYELKSASGNGSAVQLYVRGSTTIRYPGIVNTQPWLSNASSFRFLLAASGDTGGFSIRYGGNGNGAAIEVRVLSITFYKLPLYSLTFDLNGGAGTVPDSITVYEGETVGNMGKSFPAAPTLAEYTFMGWQNPAGAVVTATTPITGSWLLTAAWTKTSELALPEEEVDPATETLFAASGGSTAQKFTYDGKQWWVMAKTGTEYGTTDPVPVAPFDDAESAIYTAAVAAAKAMYTRVSYNLPTLSAQWASYSKVTITYDLVVVGGDNLAVTVRNGTGGGGDPTIASVTALQAGTDRTITLNTSDISSGNVAIVKNNTAGHTNTIFLLRITKVELLLE